MNKFFLTILMALSINNTMMSQPKSVTLKIIETSDVHGCFFPYDFISLQPKTGTLARVSTYINDLRRQYGSELILLDNGDILQGQPICYYYNYINNRATNIAANVINYLKYDAGAMGNHDIETGHSVYDKWIKEVKCPILGANIIDLKKGSPYLKPYTILKRKGIKIAVLGLLTPAIPNWLSNDLWSGLRFDEMVSSARYWMNVLKRDEKPDVIIGLFHSGRNGGITTSNYEENASLRVAQEVPGFDIVFYGHDHTLHNETITNSIGEKVVCLDPANDANTVADATLILKKDNGKWIIESQEGQLVKVSNLEPDKKFMQNFVQEINDAKAFVNKKIGDCAQTISTRDSYFGSSAFNDLILNLNLKITGADISFNAPLSLDAQIKKGPIKVSDMFKLYKFENQLYVMKMTGKEIRKHLEMSYNLWVNTMKTPEDHLLLLSDKTLGDQQRLGFTNFSFNFDSAAGIDYIVDVTKPNGQKVKILRMSNGQPFLEDHWYKVAINSYRANGGGELITQGAEIPHDSLTSRIIWRSQKDQRFYLMQEIEKAGVIDPKPNNNWKFIPEEWVKPAAERDYQILFSKK